MTGFAGYAVLDVGCRAVLISMACGVTRALNEMRYGGHCHDHALHIDAADRGGMVLDAEWQEGAHCGVEI